MRKYYAEFLGTMIFVMIGCGTIAITSEAVTSGLLLNNYAIIALAFGMALTVAIYIIGPVSGCHVNPAVSLGFYITGNLSLKDLIYYVIAQILGAILAIVALFIIMESGTATYVNYGVNVIGEGFNVFQGAAFETIFTFVFVLLILSVTSKKSFESIAGITIGLTLTVIHFIGMPITGTSLNPARSIAPALLTLDTDALSQLWIFIIFPLLGAALAGFVWKLIRDNE